MNTQSILVAYATRYGSTQQAAEIVADMLRQTGLDVDVQPMREVKSIDQYDGVVLGAAIYNTKWHPDAHQFLAQHQQALCQRPVAIFALGPLDTSTTAMRNSRRQLEGELKKYSWLKPVALEMFIGKLDPSSLGLGFFNKLLPVNDHRDLDAVRAWANALPAQLAHSKMLQFA